MKNIKLILFTIFCLLTTSLYSATIKNYDFENGESDWIGEYSLGTHYEGKHSNHYAYLYDANTIYQNIAVKKNTNYTLEFLGAYSVNNGGSTDCSNSTYTGQKVTIAGVSKNVDHWICSDNHLVRYSIDFNSGSRNSVRLSATTSNNGFLKIDYFRLIERPNNSVGSTPPPTTTKSITLTGTIINDDVKFRITDSTISNDKIHTKIVNNSFKINVYSIDENGNKIKNDLAKNVKIRIIDNNPTTWLPLDIYNKQEASTNLTGFKATKDTKIELSWQNTKSNINETQTSTDNFAIRPKEFKIILPSTPQKAGENFNFKIEALDNNGNRTQNYNEQRNISFTITQKDKKSPTCKTGTLSISKNKFINGDFSDNNAKYNNVGDLNITISEKVGSEFAKVDATDGTSLSQRLIPSTSATITFVPSKFKLDASLVDQDTADKITLYSNIPSSMGSSLDVNISATDPSGNPLSNYTNGCYSNDTNLTLFYTNSNTKDNLNFVSDKTILSQDASEFVISVDKSTYTNGTSTQNIKLNQSRVKNKAKNPNLLSINKIDINDGNTNTTKTYSTNPLLAHFYYGRAHAPSPQEASGMTLTAKLYYEVYCKGCNKSTFTNVNNKASIDSVYWYILPSSVYNKFGSDCDYNNNPINSKNGATPVRKDAANMQITAPTTPHRDRITYTPNKPYLLYDKYNSAVSNHNFDVIFTSKAPKWAGEGEKGKTVDTNISKIQNNSLEW